MGGGGAEKERVGKAIESNNSLSIIIIRSYKQYLAIKYTLRVMITAPYTASDKC